MVPAVAPACFMQYVMIISHLEDYSNLVFNFHLAGLDDADPDTTVEEPAESMPREVTEEA